MRVELTKDFTFESAHRLPMVPSDHKCFRMHGHSYRIEVSVAGEVDPKLGWLVDFGEIAARVEPVLKAELDHRVLNDVPGLENPTSEILAAWLWKRLSPLVPQLAAITHPAESCGVESLTCPRPPDLHPVAADCSTDKDDHPGAARLRPTEARA